MLHPLKKVMAWNHLHRTVGGERHRVRPQIERLEARAMLSTNPGFMPGYGGEFPPPPGGPPSHEAMLAAPPEQHAPGLGGAQDGAYGMDGPGVAPNRHYEPGPPLHDPHSAYESNWNQFTPSRPHVVYYYVIVEDSLPYGGDVYNDYNYDPFGDVGAQSAALTAGNAGAISSALKAAATMKPSGELGGASQTGAKPTDPGRLLVPGSGGRLAGQLPLGSMPLPATLSGIPTASQIVSRDVDSAALASVGALDAAFQSYASQLLIVSSSTANDHANSNTAGDVSAPSAEALDGFIGVTDIANSDAALTPQNAEQRERDAVDAVLRDLHDLDSLPAEAMSAPLDSDHGSEISIATDLSWSLESETEGGMVMLQASGDPNDSAISLAGAADNKLDILHVRVGVEASVGFYQAMDVATEDAPVANLPAAATEPAQQNESDDHRLSTKGEKGTSPKAAAVVGATTFVGALLWAGQRTRPERDLDTNSTKNRRGVIAS